MATFIVLGNFTDQVVRTIKESIKRADAFKALTAFGPERFGKILGKMP